MNWAVVWHWTWISMAAIVAGFLVAQFFVYIAWVSRKRANPTCDCSFCVRYRQMQKDQEQE